MQTANRVVYCEQVNRIYGSETAFTRALAGVSFEVYKGEFVGIMGPSGSGKTTLLNCISTIDSPSSGRIEVNGVNVEDLHGKDVARFRREELGFVFQDSNLLDTLTARENIALALTINHTKASKIPQMVEAMARRLQIAHTLDRYPHQLSGGEQQRVAIARALITDPALLIADEPTGALDSKNARRLLESLSLLHQAGATIMMVTHDAFAASYAKRILVLKDGKIFTELRRGNSSRDEFFSEILNMVGTLGSEAAHE